MSPRERRRRQYATGSVYQRCDHPTCPPLVDGHRPKHRCQGRWIGTIEAGFTKTGSRRRITVSGKTELEAKRRMEKRRSELSRGGPVETSRETVKTWAEKWLAMTSRTARPKTHVTDRGAVNAYIIPTIGHRRLDELTPSDIRAVDEAVRDAGKTTTTALRYRGTLNRILKAAVEEGLPVAPRALGVKLPEKAVHNRQAVQTTHALTMLEVASTMPHGSRWAAAFLQGMRQGECLGLTWPEVDGEALAVSWQLQSLPYVDKKDRSKGFLIPDGYEARQLDRSAHLVRPKSRAGWRVIPLVDWMGDALQTWRVNVPDSPHDLVWPDANGRPRSPVADRDEWRYLQDEAKVRHPAGRYYALHEARHATATLLMELKVPEAVIVAIMGHSSILSSKGYMHVDQTLARDALARVADRLGLGR